jgi:ribonuclease HI
MSKTLVYVDGSGWNGRETKYCVVWGRGDKWEHRVFHSIEEKTNNEMEYLAVIYGLKNFKLTSIYTDSELVVNQVDGKYKVKHIHLLPLRDEARKWRDRNRNTLVWIPREENKAGKLLER